MARVVRVSGALRAACGRTVSVMCEAARAAVGGLSRSDQPGAPAARAFSGFEPLESRQLLSAAWLDNGILKVTGNRDQRNTLSVTVSGSNYVAKANSLSKTFPASSVKSIK